MNITDRRRLEELRKRIFLTAYAGNVGHIASAYSCLELLYSLYLKGVLNYDIHNPTDDNRDIFILSKGHGSLALYNILCDAGFITEDMLMTFCQPESSLGGEPHCLDVPGVEASTGSLGHGLSIGVGIAIANKLDKKNSITYVMVGDGECQEGSIWEAVMTAVKYKLNNLIVIIDSNRLQKMGPIKDIMGIDSWTERWSSFGWDVIDVDGHDVDAIVSVLKKSLHETKPRVIIANTTKGKGVSIMENNPDWHFKMPNKRELKIIVTELSITEEELERCRKHT